MSLDHSDVPAPSKHASTIPRPRRVKARCGVRGLGRAGTSSATTSKGRLLATCTFGATLLRGGADDYPRASSLASALARVWVPVARALEGTASPPPSWSHRPTSPSTARPVLDVGAS